MAKFFGNLGAVIGVSVLLLLVVIFALHRDVVDASYMRSFVLFLHVLCGVMWIGLLYYFNFVQIPTMPKVPAELKPGVSKYIAPEALFWFRWGAALTVLMGLIIAGTPWPGRDAYILQALMFQSPYRVIGLGMWFGLIMAFNVWFVIWPNQKKALGLVEADADTKAKAATTAMMFSRTNTLLSIPMLYCMVTQAYLGV
ncbi:urate hydroxylase PuuD [Flavisphingomonas formosensis]|uniref:urate hydroxylase PuuD n=1 Tax=Flavisphingomonas formosensis TaxID=861534 RepID=UPI0012FA9047|nr:urate hydroxylase PuuD [Sphingomonas formosensis]